MSVLPLPHTDIVVNLAELRLYVWRQPDQAPVTMPIGQGRARQAPRTAVVPESVGTRDGAGCIELYPEDFVRLAFHTRPGQPVTVIDQPVKAARTDDELLLEVHSDASGRRRASAYAVAVTVLAACSDQSWEVDWQEVRKISEEARGVPTNVLRVRSE